VSRPRPNITLIAAVAAIAVLALVGIHALAAQARPAAADAAGVPAGHAAAAKQFAAKLTTKFINQGHTKGNTTVGIVATGNFSAKLGSGAKLVAAVMSLATGIPYADIARGGTYKELYSDSGTKSGIAIATFSDRALGKACLKVSAKSGKFTPGLDYVPLSGTMTVVGGTGAAAHWTAGASFNETAVTGSSTESFRYGGSFSVSTAGRARGFTAACRAAAKS
jgi:hypothetical protein